jgi:hypothetical protein
MSSESNDPSDEQRTPNGTNKGFVREHFATNGLAWGVGDLLLAAGSLDVLGDLLACILDFFDEETRKRVVHWIVLIQPADLGDERPVLSAIGEAVARLRGEKLSPDEEGIVSKALRLVSVPTLSAEAVIAAVGEAEARSAVLIRSAAAYRFADIPAHASTEGLLLPEDACSPCACALRTGSSSDQGSTGLPGGRCRRAMADPQSEPRLTPINRRTGSSRGRYPGLGCRPSVEPPRFVDGRHPDGSHRTDPARDRRTSIFASKA